MSLGKRLTPILVEIEQTLWEYESYGGGKPDYDKEALGAAIKIFMSVMMDKMWELQHKESLDMEDRGNMAISLGTRIRELVKEYVDIDTHDLYK